MPTSKKTLSPFSTISLRLRPSESHRWVGCTASPFLIEENKDSIDDSESVYAAEGTKAHDLGANSILMGWDEKDFQDKEMAEYVKGYAEFVLSQVEEDDELLIEESVNLFFDPENESGTPDCAILTVDGNKIIKVRINDLKYGMGVSVQAKKNTQLSTYAMSVVQKALQRGLTISHDALVSLSIYQPRVIGERAIRNWTILYGELDAFCVDINESARIIKAAKSWDDVKFSPGEHTCRFCEAKPFCSTYAGYLLQEVPEVADEVLTVSEPTLPEVSQLTYEQISALVKNKKQIEKWLSSLEDFVFHHLNSGKRISGFKLVQGREGNRAWTDAAKADRFLARFIPKKERTKTTLVSPAQAEKLLKSKELPDNFEALFKKQISRSTAGKILAGSDDPRTALNIDAQSEFSEYVDLTEEQKNLLD